MKYLIPILLCILLFVSCEKKEAKPETIWDKYIYNNLNNNPSIYDLHNNDWTKQVGFGSFRFESIYQHAPWKDKLVQDSELTNAPLGNFSINANGYDLYHSNSESKYPDSLYFSAWYGQDVTYIIKEKTYPEINNGIEIDTLTMYVPKTLEIISPLTENFDPINYKNFELQWNADTNNTNGVQVTIDWDEIYDTINGEPRYISVRNTDVIPDNGYAILNHHLFDSIPDRVYVTLSLLRCNLTKITIGNIPYKIIAESRDCSYYNFIVKELD